MGKFTKIVDEYVLSEVYRVHEIFGVRLHSLCGVPLKTSVEMIGYFQASFCVFALTMLGVCALGQGNPAIRALLPLDDVSTLPLVLLTTSLLIAMHLVVNVFLIIGAKSENLPILKTWIIYTLIHITFAAVHSFILSCMELEVNNYAIVVPMTILTILYEATALYFCLVVNSLYHSILDNRFGDSTIEQIHKLALP